MTQEGLKRIKVMELLQKKSINQLEASELLDISTRQVKRVLHCYRQRGDKALNHGLIGRQSNNHKDPGEKEEIMALVRNELKGYKPKFTSEKLEELYEKTVRANTLRLWMMEEGLWEKTRKTGKHRTRRPRKDHFGEMIQMDGSPHDWFGTGEEFCLMNMIDDATNIEFGLFAKGETTDIALRCLYSWVEKYGIPQMIYTDHGSVYYTDQKSTIEDQLKGRVPKTRFGRVCDELGIEIIYAGSPQAKGRVERANGVQQDRLIPELKIAGIKEEKGVNAYLVEKYWNKHNAQFSIKPLSDADYHIPLINGQDLRNIICYKEERTVNPDYVVRNDNRFFQLQKDQPLSVKSKDKIIVRIWLDGSVHISKKNTELVFIEIQPVERKNIA
jgi:transposase InsO family protein